MKDETEYYDWDNIPCVFIEDSDGGLFGFYMPGEHTSWIKADAMVYLECRFKIPTIICVVNRSVCRFCNILFIIRKIKCRH